ncbi:hypothetical protein LCGC14_2192240 [marine sediment metagenome]|uniref:Uncharacterized protein n=1 Tax=marine sediment metagenome TaxID=412755 RepID=A0A0F9E6B4_9ZZZZ
MDGNNRHWLNAGEGFRRHQNCRKMLGYCENTECDKYLRGSFMWMHKGPFACCKCGGSQGFLVPERGIRTGPPNAIYGEVRIEYCYDPAQKRYCEIAILRDDALGDRVRTFTFQTPLVRTEKRAFKLAAGYLATLNDGIELALENDTEIPRAIEHVVNFDSPREEFSERMRQLGWALKDNAFFQEPMDVFSLFNDGEEKVPNTTEEIDSGS